MSMLFLDTRFRRLVSNPPGRDLVYLSRTWHFNVFAVTIASDSSSPL